MKIIDLHSHWGTRRGYPLQTEKELAQQRATWNSETRYHTEAEMAAYFRASSADQLSGVLTDLPRPVERQLRQVELSVGLVAAAVLALLAAVALSVRWKVFP